MAKKALLRDTQYKYIKGGMYALNCLVVILGLALGGVGLWIKVDFNAREYREVLDPVFTLCHTEDAEFDFSIRVHMDTIAYFLIFLGVAIVGTGFLGVCGTFRERTTLLAMFCLLLFIILAILLTAGIQAMVKKDTSMECESRLTQQLDRATAEYHTVESQRLFMDQIQHNISCCGSTKGAADYDLKLEPFPCDEKYKTEPSSRPCAEAIKDFFEAINDNMIMILVVSFCIGIFTIIGMGMSTYLFVSLRHIKDKLYK